MSFIAARGACAGGLAIGREEVGPGRCPIPSSTQRAGPIACFLRGRELLHAARAQEHARPELVQRLVREAVGALLFPQQLLELLGVLVAEGMFQY